MTGFGCEPVPRRIIASMIIVCRLVVRGGWFSLARNGIITLRCQEITISSEVSEVK